MTMNNFIVILLLFIICLAMTQPVTKIENYVNTTTMNAEYLTSINPMLNKIASSPVLSKERKDELITGLKNHTLTASDIQKVDVTMLNDYGNLSAYILSPYTELPARSASNFDFRDVKYHEDPENLKVETTIKVKNKWGRLIDMPWSTAVTTTPFYSPPNSFKFGPASYVPDYTESILLSRNTNPRAR